MSRLKRTKSVVNYSEVVEDEDGIQISLIPNPNTSDVEDESDGDSDSENSNHSDIEDIENEILSYRKVFENYNETQKYLENNHEYKWVDGEKSYHNVLSNEYLLAEKDKKYVRVHLLSFLKCFFL